MTTNAQTPGPTVACPGCGSTTFQVEFQTFATVTVADGIVTAATAGPQGDAADFLTHASCTGCGLAVGTEDGLRGAYLAGPDGDPADDTTHEDALLAAVTAATETASSAVLTLYPDGTAAASADRAQFRATLAEITGRQG